MKMEIKYTARFRKEYRKADKEIKESFSETLQLFFEDPDHPSLRNHSLKEKFAGYRSIDVTDDWRGLFKEKSARDQTVITFHRIATHKDLYG